MTAPTVLVTGAGGFLGRAVVRAAVAEGLRVRALVRRDAGGRPAPGDAEVVVADLRADDLAPALAGVDVVVHLAAAKGGDFHSQYASTVRGTERFLDAAAAAGVRRVVLCSSFAVYDYERLPDGAAVDESTPLDLAGHGRDAYAQAEVLQEQVARERCAAAGTELVVLRPGVVHGDGPEWTYRVGERFGRLWVALGSRSRVPLVHVEDCARALVLAATSAAMAGGTYDVLADDPPTQAEYRRSLAARTSPRPLVLVVPWPLARALAVGATALAARSARPWRLPGFLVPASLSVRARPLVFSGAALRGAGWAAHRRWDGSAPPG